MLDKSAVTQYPINDLARTRWSPLAFDSTRAVPMADLLSILEAGRWAASSNNGQPWRFIVGAKPDDVATWEKLYSCLLDRNQVWAKNAPVLLLAVARKRFEYNEKENRWWQHDTGQAMANIAMEATAHGLHVHQMGGYNVDKAREVFQIGDDFEPMATAAIGYLADSSVLEDTTLIERHENPLRQRKPLSEIVFGGVFGESSPLVME